MCERGDRLQSELAELRSDIEVREHSFAISDEGSVAEHLRRAQLRLENLLSAIDFHATECSDCARRARSA